MSIVENASSSYRQQMCYGVSMNVGDYVRYGGKVYKIIQIVDSATAKIRRWVFIFPITRIVPISLLGYME